MAACHKNVADDMMSRFFTLQPIGDSSLRVAPTTTGGLGLRSRHDNELELERQRQREEEYARFSKECQEEEAMELRSHLKLTPSEEGGSQGSQFSEVDDTTSAGGIADVNEFQQEETTKIFDNYYRTYEEIHYDPKLVIGRHRQRLLSTIRTHPVVIVRGPTGCGKTTQLPQYILDEHIGRGIHCNIVVTQPRRIAATSVASRVCQERGWPLGSVVGYQIALDSVTSPDTRITYMTTGVLLQKLIAAKNMNMFTHVIIDEVHERDQDTDLTILIVRKFLRSNSRATKVILMSATIDTDIFANYFESAVQGQLRPAPAIDIDSKPHSVSEHYITELGTLGQIPLVEFDNPSIHNLAFDLVCNLICTFDQIEVQEQCDNDDDDDENIKKGVKLRGSVLVFLPGYDQISELQSKLARLREKKNWWILPLHSTITMEEQKNVFKPPPHGSRKIILSTNIAESSVTVPDIRYVIDFCLTKVLVSDPTTNYCSLQVQWASKSSCDQRKGRAGRVAQGRVYRMVPVSFYDRHLEMYGIPEMRRCPLELVILKIKRLEMGEPKALLSLALERPDLNDIERAILVLKEVGALAGTVNGAYSRADGDLTFIGHVMSQLPLDVHVSKLILLGFIFDCLEDCIIMAASLSVQSFFSKPFQEVLQCYKSRLSWASDTFSDVLASLAAYRMWQEHQRTGYFHRPLGHRRQNQELVWCKDSFIQIKRIREVKSLVEELKRRLLNIGIKTIPYNYTEKPLETAEHVLILKVAICGAFYPNYFVQEEMEQKDIFRQIPKLNPRNTVMVSGLPPKHSFMYESALVNLFRECSPHIQVTFDNQKAYIQFGKSTGEMGTGVLQEAYIALKMRHQRDKISIPGLSTEEIQQKLQILENLKAENSQITKCLGSSQKNQTLTHGVFPRIRLPEVDKITVRLHVTYVVDCGHFWAQYIDDEDVPGKEAFLKEKINMYGGRNLKPVTGAVHRGMLVLAPWAEANEQSGYYRAYIEDIKEKHAEIFYLDYGNGDVVPISVLREIDQKLGSEILTVPALAVQCKLSEIRPAATKASRFGHWSLESREWFKEYVMYQEVIGQIYSVTQGIIRLELRKVFDNGLEAKINEYLIEQGYAEKSEEDYMSKQNHLLREKCQDMDMVQLSQLNQQQQEDNVLLLGQKDGLFTKMTLHKSLARPTFRLPLRGPMSPLEVSYCGVTKLTSGRRIRIERDSVNSVTLNREPENPHSCMLVACNIGLDSAGSAIIARSTTEMPSIHELPALMALLFCPQAEFRVDSQRSKYTGALAGLGVYPNTNTPVYADHDIEMVFDTAFDLEDIVLINTVRLSMNLILDNSEEGGQRGPQTIKKLQRKTREGLLRLLNRQRKYQERQPFLHSFAWNKVPQEYILPIPTEVGKNSPELFKLHKAVELVDISSWIEQQLEQLRLRAVDGSEVEVNKCPVCEYTCYTRSDLRMHLESEEHQKQMNYYIKN